MNRTYSCDNLHILASASLVTSKLHAGCRRKPASCGSPHFRGPPALTGRWAPSRTMRMPTPRELPARTRHIVTNVVIEVDEQAGTAVSRSYFTALQALPDLALQPIALPRGGSGQGGLRQRRSRGCPGTQWGGWWLGGAGRGIRRGPRRLQNAADQDVKSPGQPVRTRTGQEVKAEGGNVRVPRRRGAGDGLGEPVFLLTGIDGPLAGALLGGGRSGEEIGWG